MEDRSLVPYITGAEPRAADRVIAPVLAVNLPVFDLRLNASDSPVTFPRPIARREIA